MKRMFLILVVESLLTIASASLKCLSTSPRSPRDRKTKSPGSFGSCSSPIPLESPRLKRAKIVSINENHDLLEYSRDSEENLDCGVDEGGFKGEPVEIVGKLTEESPQSVSSLFLTLETLRPILKRRLTVSKRYPTTIHLFRNGKDAEVAKFYDQGTQLGIAGEAVDEMFKYLLETGQTFKLKIIYNRDRTRFLDFVIKSRGTAEIRSIDVLELAPICFEGNEDLILEFQAIAMENVDSYALRAAFYLNAVGFETSTVYKMLNDLLEDPSDLGGLTLARELLHRYNSVPREPLLIFAAKNDSEEALLSILAFDPAEIDRLDGEGYSVMFHAAREGNLGILAAVKDLVGGVVNLTGVCPLIGAAMMNRDDSLKFFLEDFPESFTFSVKEIEDAAFASAAAGNIGILRILLKRANLNLHCHRGASTLLSTALKNDRIGYAHQLVERLGYDVNFVGDDSINPSGNALILALDKLSTVELFLKKGANRNVLVPVKDSTTFPDTPSGFIPLAEYLERCGDEKLVKMFNKYT